MKSSDESGFPRPQPGLVIRYSYLWHSEFRAGREEGLKDRPCAIILALATSGEKEMVMVVPVTHSPPDDPSVALEIPAAVKKRLGLDDLPSWVILTEANQFAWPGPDLRRAQSGEGGIAYGLLPEILYERMRAKFLEILRARKAKLVIRTG
ncbi:MAG TPA: hypothetical protein VMS78_01735 [Rhizomicrobium sp.]|nr:hypothetical protein [Rhizomicrobium sp.]